MVASDDNSALASSCSRLEATTKLPSLNFRWKLCEMRQPDPFHDSGLTVKYPDSFRYEISTLFNDGIIAISHTVALTEPLMWCLHSRNSDIILLASPKAEMSLC